MEQLPWHFSFILLLVPFSQAEKLVIYPAKLNTLREGLPQTLGLGFSNCSSNNDIYRNITLRLLRGSDDSLSFPPVVYNIPCVGENESVAIATIKGNKVGFVRLGIHDQRSQTLLEEYDVGIIRPSPGIQDLVYLYGLMFCIVLITLCFGLSLDLQNVKKHLKKPIAPVIGMGCQYIIMPLVGFAMTFIVTSDAAAKLGVFACAAAPGGGFSNIIVMVFGGDVDLSITMTFISTIVAMGFVPLWIYTLGQWLVEEYRIVFPFANMAQTLALVVVPLAIGIVITRFLPKVSKVILYLHKPSIVIMFLFAIGMNIWVNFYAFKVVISDYRVLICAIFLPYAGGISGYLIALALRQGPTISMTVGIETAIQNNNIAIILLKSSLPQPWADISSALPITMLIFTVIPFPFLIGGQQIYQRYQKNKKQKEKDIEENDMKMKDEVGVVNPAITNDEEI